MSLWFQSLKMWICLFAFYSSKLDIFWFGQARNLVLPSCIFYKENDGEKENVCWTN